MVVQFVKNHQKVRPYYYESSEINFKTLVDFDFKKLIYTMRVKGRRMVQTRKPSDRARFTAC